VIHSDIWRLSLENLWRTKLRSVLTTLGVVIGIGALVSMVSFGVGMQENVTREFRENDLFTSMQVLPAPIDLQDVMSGDFEPAETIRALGDSAVESMRALPGVALAFPEISFPVTVRLGERETKATLRAVPASMGGYAPFSSMEHGRFYSGDADSSVVMTRRVLRELGLRIREDESLDTREGGESLASVPLDSLIGASLEVASATVDLGQAARTFMRTLAPPSSLPLREETTRLRIVGVVGGSSAFNVGRFGRGIVVPTETAAAMPRLGFSSVWDLLDDEGAPGGYESVYVRVRAMDDLPAVREAVESMGYGVIAVADQLEEIRRSFLIMDALLGTVGTIALVVAGLGIINTMITSILERTREIGVMKAIGGSEGDIRRIFFSEAATIGLVGGAFGILLGWIVTRVANAVANHYLRPQGVPEVDLFHIPLWLIAGALVFSMGVSLLAGVYPASRAAGVDPVRALRHD
jgi:putative ABC transport system permease protein